MGSKLIEWREWVVNNVLLFVEELREDQDAWLSTALKHVQVVYQQSSATFVVQLLAFTQLLQQLRVAVVGKRSLLGFKRQFLEPTSGQQVCKLVVMFTG